MSFSKPGNKEDWPWLRNAPLDQECSFEVKVNSPEDGENDKGWTVYFAQFKNMYDAEGDEIIGTGEVPFYLMESFYKWYIEASEGKKVGWITGAYTQTLDPKDDKKRYGAFE